MSFSNSNNINLGQGAERPKYEILKKLDDNIEIRLYKNTKWVSTSINGHFFNSNNETTMFYKLFNYISGENEKREKIAMTSPVTVAYNSNEIVQPNSVVKMTMGFYVPIDKQAKTAYPTSQDTFLRSESNMIVAVIKFGGFASTDDYLYHRDILIKTLGKEANNYDIVNMITARYDPPFKKFNRTNEVWLRKIN